MAHRPRLICLMGPTASGKTDLAIELAAARLRHLPLAAMTTRTRSWAILDFNASRRPG